MNSDGMNNKEGFIDVCNPYECVEVDQVKLQREEENNILCMKAQAVFDFIKERNYPLTSWSVDKDYSSIGIAIHEHDSPTFEDLKNILHDLEHAGMYISAYGINHNGNIWFDISADKSPYFAEISIPPEVGIFQDFLKDNGVLADVNNVTHHKEEMEITIWLDNDIGYGAFFKIYEIIANAGFFVHCANFLLSYISVSVVSPYFIKVREASNE